MYTHLTYLYSFFITVLPTTSQPPDALMHEQDNIIPTHDWHQTEKHIVISIYTKRKGTPLY